MDVTGQSHLFFLLLLFFWSFFFFLDKWSKHSLMN